MPVQKNELIASEFTGHLISGRSVSHPSSIYDLWNEIDGADSFPENELVAARKTVGGIQNRDEGVCYGW